MDLPPNCRSQASTLADEYEVLNVLGKGAFGVVEKVRWKDSKVRTH